MKGRPKDLSNVEQPTKFKRTYKDKDGITDIWTYDLNKNPSGPISVEINYPKNFNTGTKDQDLENKYKNAPISQRKWLAPSGKMVGYQRAKSLGLVK